MSWWLVLLFPQIMIFTFFESMLNVFECILSVHFFECILNVYLNVIIFETILDRVGRLEWIFRPSGLSTVKMFWGLEVFIDCWNPILWLIVSSVLNRNYTCEFSSSATTKTLLSLRKIIHLFYLSYSFSKMGMAVDLLPQNCM